MLPVTSCWQQESVSHRPRRSAVLAPSRPSSKAAALAAVVLLNVPRQDLGCGRHLYRHLRDLAPEVLGDLAGSLAGRLEELAQELGECSSARRVSGWDTRTASYRRSAAVRAATTELRLIGLEVPGRYLLPSTYRDLAI